MILLRLILVGLIIFLIIRTFIRYMESEKPSSNRTVEHGNGEKTINKRVSKEIGEYVDYEDVDK